MLVSRRCGREDGGRIRQGPGRPRTSLSPIPSGNLSKTGFHTHRFPRKAGVPESLRESVSKVLYGSLKAALDGRPSSKIQTGARAISQSYNVLATTSRMDGSRNLGRGLAAIAAKNGPAEIAALVGSDGRRNVCLCKTVWSVCDVAERLAEVGKTKKGKGTKIMLMTDGQGLPLSVFQFCGSQHAGNACRISRL
jgi:hypothetical protein